MTRSLPTDPTHDDRPAGNVDDGPPAPGSRPADWDPNDATTRERGDVPPTVWPVFLTYVIVLVGVQILGVMAIVAAVAATMVRSPDLAADEMRAQLDQVFHSPAMLLASGVISALTLILASLAAVGLERARPAERLLLVPRALGLRFWIVTSMGFLAASQAFDSLLLLLDLDPGGSIEFLARVMRSATGVLFALLLIFIGPVAGFAEEMFFRGYMQTRLRRRWSAWPAITVTAAAFGIMHLDPFHSVFAFLVGLFLGWIAEKAGTILPAIAAHVLNNSVWAVTTATLPGPLSTITHLWLLGLTLAITLGSVTWLARRPGTGLLTRT